MKFCSLDSIGDKSNSIGPDKGKQKTRLFGKTCIQISICSTGVGPEQPHSHISPEFRLYAAFGTLHSLTGRFFRNKTFPGFVEAFAVHDVAIL